MTVISYTQPSGPVPFHQPQVQARDTDPNAFGHSLQPRYLLKAFTILGKVWAFLDMATLARGLGEDVAAAFGDVGWRVQVQGHSEVATLIPDTVDAKLVCHVRHRVLFICLFGYDLHRLLDIGFREVVSGLG